jgi:hypothetical protein
MSFAAAATPPACAASPARRADGRRAVASAHGTSSARPSGHGTRAPAPRRARGDAAVAAVAAGSAPPARVARRPDASVEEKFWEWEGHRIRYTEAGDEGPAMILVHGFGGNADHWRKNAPVLGKHGRVFAIDLLGYGYSSKPDPMKLEQNAIYNFENWSRQLRAFIEDGRRRARVFDVQLRRRRRRVTSRGGRQGARQRRLLAQHLATRPARHETARVREAVH